MSLPSPLHGLTLFASSNASNNALSLSLGSIRARPVSREDRQQVSLCDRIRNRHSSVNAFRPYGSEGAFTRLFESPTYRRISTPFHYRSVLPSEFPAFRGNLIFYNFTLRALSVAYTAGNVSKGQDTCNLRTIGFTMVIPFWGNFEIA